MNRRAFLAATAVLPSALASSAQTLHPGQTHVDSKLGGPALKSAVVKSKGLSVDGDAPGAKVKVNFNGPTGQLASPPKSKPATCSTPKPTSSTVSSTPATPP